jgi:hypothetical protein
MKSESFILTTILMSSLFTLSSCGGCVGGGGYGEFNSSQDQDTGAEQDGPAHVCGDNVCEPLKGENCNNCSEDCACQKGETCTPQGTCCNEKITPDALLLIDSSSAMNSNMGVSFKDGFDKPSKKTRWEATKKALKKSMNNFKNELNFGLMFSNNYASKKGTGGNPCSPGDIIPPPVPGGQIVSEMQKITPDGKNPLASALLKGAGAFSKTGEGTHNTIIIITEDGDTCGGDLNAAVSQLTAQGFDIRIVALADTEAPGELNSAAKAGGNDLVLMDGSEDFDTVFNDIYDDANSEKCDGKDNDCNGEIDDNLIRECTADCGGGVQYCKNGEWGGCTDSALAASDEIPDVPKEQCDGIDNDCNGQTDESFNVGGLCFKSLGVCKSTGNYICSYNKSGVVCNAPEPSYGQEICDNKDNDCDGLTDEDLLQECNSPCGKGLMKCLSGQWQPCIATQINPEICDGKDNDCDGLTDEEYDVGEICVVCNNTGTVLTCPD